MLTGPGPREPWKDPAFLPLGKYSLADLLPTIKIFTICRIKTLHDSC